MSQEFNRRQFLGHAATFAGAGLGFASLAAAQPPPKEKKVAASERITLGLIGIGTMGGAHLDYYVKSKRVEIVAVCDVYEPHRRSAKKRVGEKCTEYSDYRALLDRKDIDAVVIATPDHWHTLVALNAAQAGKDIYCEKPLTLTIGEGRPLIKAVHRYGRILQVGTQQRSDVNFRYACELARNGKLGKILSVETGFGTAPSGGDPAIIAPPAGLDWDMYQGPTRDVPFQKDRYGFTFRWFYDYSGGMMTDWGAHHNDIAQWGLGMDASGPVSIEGTGVFPDSGAYEVATSFEVNYTYENGVKLNCKTGQHGVKFIGEKGWVYVDRGFLQASLPELLHIDFGPNDTRLYASDNHRENFLDCLKTREKPIADVETAFRSVTVCHLGNIALRTGRKLTWNPQTERFVGDEEANRWLSRPYRAPWHLD